MWPRGTIRHVDLLVASTVLLALAAPSRAAWLGYKNETKTPVVIQTSALVNGKIVRGKPYVLFPGEMAWDNIPAPGIRQIGVYDPKNNSRLLHQDAVNVQNQDIFLVLRFDAPPQQPGKAAIPPQYRFIAVKAPGPPGVVPPKEAPKSPAPTTPVPPKSTLPPTAKPGTPTPTPKTKSK